MDEIDRRADIGSRDEDAYFRERDLRLIEEARLADAAKAERDAIGQVLGVDDEAILIEIRQLGYDAETVKLLPILPLVRVAWSEGFVTGRERSAILEAAKSRGIVEGSEAFGKLQVWLDEPPSDPFYQPSLQLLGRVMRERKPESLATSMQEIIAACTKVAAASGGFFGFGASISDVEQGVIDRVNAALQSGPTP